MAVGAVGQRAGRWRAEAVAGGVGAGLGALLAGLTLVHRDDFDLFGCREVGGFACLGPFFLLLLSVLLLTAVLGWIALRVAGVRPAWRVALAGPLLAWFAALRLDGLELFAGAWWLPALTGAAYALAAWLVLPVPARRRAQLAVVAVLVLLWPLVGHVERLGHPDRRQDGLAKVTVPLLAPDLGAFRLEGSAVTGTTPDEFGYRLVRTDDPAATVRVSVARPMPGFAPPSCLAASFGGTPFTESCEQVSPDTWRASGYDYHVSYVRRDGALALLESRGGRVTEAEMLKLAASVKARGTGYFG